MASIAFFGIFGVATALCAVSAPAQDTALHAQVERRIVEITDAALVRHGIPGAVVGVRIGGAGTWLVARGKADLDAGRDAEATDPIRIGSVTKSFTAVAALQLADRGLLDLDDALDRVDAGAKVPHAAEITVRMLLNHTSGIFDYANDEVFEEDFATKPDKTWTPEELVDIAVSHGPDFPPGARWAYSNTNYILLGMIAEEVSGEFIGDLIRENIVEPLGLACTVWPDGPTMEDPCLHGYWDPGCTGVLKDCSRYEPTAEFGAGAMISCVEDLLVWAKAFAEGALLGESVRREQRTLVDAGGGGRWGLGVSFVHGFYGHGGNIRGYDISMYHLPSRDASFAILLNRQVGWEECSAPVVVSASIFKEIAAELVKASSLLQLDLNGREAAVGDTVSVLATAAHLVPPFDAYCVVEDPAGTLFSLGPGGAVMPGVSPFARGVPFVSDPVTVELFRDPIPPGLRLGRYRVTLGICDPGARPSLDSAREYRQDLIAIR
ncbi:MAG: beta-lactamase family protein [Candidatus Aureabacteria bacterium]|nr:beta-lactamase family protein [Candidatus Auribacterota bacterium]